MFKLLGQNQVELARSAVLCFWRSCKRKQSGFCVAYRGPAKLDQNFLVFQVFHNSRHFQDSYGSFYLWDWRQEEHRWLDEVKLWFVVALAAISSTPWPAASSVIRSLQNEITSARLHLDDLKSRVEMRNSSISKASEII